MSNVYTQLSSFQNTDHSLSVKSQRATSREQKSAQAFLSDHASGNFIMRFNRSFHNMGHVFIAVLFALFVIVLLFGILIGTSVYKSLHETDLAMARERSATMLLYNTIRTVDSFDALDVQEGPEGPVLVMKEALPSGTYETRLYLYEGQLLEEYTLAQTPLDPAHASTLIETEVFDFEYMNGLLSIMTSHGTIDIALRAASGGE